MPATATIRRPTFLRSLTEEAKNGNLPIGIGREREVEQLTRIVAGEKATHALLLGPPGVGKTQLIRSLAVELARQESLYEILELDQTDFSSDTKWMGEIESKLKDLIQYASEDPHRIIFIDEFHAFMGVGSHTGKATGIEQQLKPALTAGRMRVIAATTEIEFEQHVAGDAAMVRRFHRVDVAELTAEKTLQVLQHINSLNAATGQPNFLDQSLEEIIAASKEISPRVADPARSISLYSQLQVEFRAQGDGITLQGDPTNILQEAAALLEGNAGSDTITRFLKKHFSGQPGAPVDSGAVKTLLGAHMKKSGLQQGAAS